MIAEGEWRRPSGAPGSVLLCAFLGCWQRRVGDRLLGPLFRSCRSDVRWRPGEDAAFKGISPACCRCWDRHGAVGFSSTWEPGRGLVQVDAQLGRQTGGDIRRWWSGSSVGVRVAVRGGRRQRVRCGWSMFSFAGIVTAGPLVEPDRSWRRSAAFVGGDPRAAVRRGDRRSMLARAIGPLGGDIARL